MVMLADGSVGGNAGGAVLLTQDFPQDCCFLLQLFIVGEHIREFDLGES